MVSVIPLGGFVGLATIKVATRVVVGVRSEKKKGKSSRTRLDRLDKVKYMKVGSMAWDVLIHACSHGLLGGGYGFEGFHGCNVMVFFC